MQLKVTVLGSGDHSSSEDLEIEADPRTTVTQLAQELGARNPRGAAVSATTIRLHGNSTTRLLDGASELANAGILSGATLSLAHEAHAPSSSASSRPVAAVLRVTQGPDAGREFDLYAGTSVVGRERTSDVVFTDFMVSRQHLRAIVTDTVEVVDLGSANGTLVDGQLASRARLEPTTDVTVGDTTFRVRAIPSAVRTSSWDVGAYNRSPVLEPRYPGETLRAPKVPEDPKPSRIPIVAAIAPVVLGAAMYAFTGRIESLLFMALSPLVLIGNTIENRFVTKRTVAKAIAEFNHRLNLFAQDAAAMLAREAQARRAEHPPTDSLVAALHDRTPLLWCRRPDGDHFLEVMLGRADLPARATYEMPQFDGCRDDLVGQLRATCVIMSTVTDVPLAVDLRSLGTIGFAGERVRTSMAAASAVLQLALLHSPAELSIGLIASDTTSGDWDWLKWLPHTGGRDRPISAGLLVRNTASAIGLIGELKQLIDQRGGRPSHGSVSLTPAIVIIVEDDAPVERSLLVELLESGPAAGVHLLWVAPKVTALPAGCGVVVDLAGAPHACSVTLRRDAVLHSNVVADWFASESYGECARSLSPLFDVGAKGNDDASLPKVVAGPELVKVPVSASPDILVERWGQSALSNARRSDPGVGGLRAAVGVAGGEPFVVDLRLQGPHALVGGTTGAGKSEFLQAWVIGLAMSYSPQRISFLFVDYKGGAAFSECVKLPHSVGLVTDLNPHLVDRALTSLNAELRFREHLLRARDAKDIHELERRNDPETPPALIIVIDEFAALVQEVPEFVAGVVNVAQRGRSLGLHLVLATQRPAGVITGNLRANTNLRVALRMADETDSSDVVDTRDAAFIDVATPGRGLAKVGPGRIQPFQSAYYGGWSSAAMSTFKIGIKPLRIGPAEPWPSGASSGVPKDDGPNDLVRLVELSRKAALLSGIPEPRKPWLPELPRTWDLRKLQMTRTDSEITFGIQDDPENQSQPPISYFPDHDGSLAIFGSSGSGKSTLLRTIAQMAGVTSKGGPCHVYCLDFGSRSLQFLEGLPQVGSVIAAEDHERISRLLRDLRAMIDDRQARYQDVDTIVAYRSAANAPNEPRVLLLVDNFGAFRQAYDSPDRSRWLDLFQSILADGRSVGVHVVLTADRPGAVPTPLASLISRRLVLRMATDSDYLMFGVPPDLFSARTPPGRGYADGREFQVAVLGGTENIKEQAQLSAALGANPTFSGSRSVAAPVRCLPELVRLADLPASTDGRPTFGLGDDDLLPVTFRPSGAFIVSGPPGSGRTTAVASLSMAMRRWRPSSQCVLFAQRRSQLRLLMDWTAWADEAKGHVELAKQITSDIAATDDDLAGLMIVVESVADILEDQQAEAPLLALLKAATGQGALVVVEAETASLSRLWKLDFMKSQRTGLILQPQQADGEAILKSPFPRIGKAEFPLGRGFYAENRRLVKVQCAVPDIGD